MEIKIIVAYISSYSGLLPIAAGVLFCRSRPFNLFIYFLIYGLLTDLVVGFLQEGLLAYFIQNLYSLIDALFLIWFISMQGIFKTHRKWLRIVLPGILMAWFFAYEIYKPIHIEVPSSAAFYECAYEILLSILAAFALLKISETSNDRKTRVDTWFLAGIFFYNFTSFFSFAFISNEISHHIWFLPITFNIITMVLYTIGFMQLRNSQND